MERVDDDQLPRVYLLVASPDAAGGIARATVNLANELVERYRVEIIGLRRLATGRRYTFDPRVHVRYVSDLLGPLGDWTGRLPSLRPGFSRRHGHSPLIDLHLRRILRTLEPGTVISTRPSLHVASVRHTPDDCVTIGQDHLNLDFRVRNRSLALVRRAIRGLDHFVVLTEADATRYREAFPDLADRIHAIPNAAPWSVGARGQPREKVVIAAGQLGIRKGFDRLIEAYALIASDHPNWRLHIYGAGPKRDELQAQIRSRGLGSAIQLKGRTAAMERVMEHASIFALTSRHEGFPMVLVEAMTKGLPAVSYDCPRGPAEIVVDRETGFLVDDGDEMGFAIGLARLMDDPKLREQMSAAALERARNFQPNVVFQRWIDLLEAARQNRTANAS